MLLRVVMVSGKTFTANTFLFMNWKITLQQKRFKLYIFARLNLGLSRILAKVQKLQTVHVFS